ncbi:MAG: hypothetical protein JSW26_13685 [Desulfobacterales bacterium]|nr:MAG: hypothetical protein JSW26_13685 [Desulfobacterales bacterium]
MLEMVIENHAIRFGPRCAVSFQRTLRIPDDGRTYPLPPGLGAFRIHRVDDYKDNLPQEWQKEGSAFITMYQREALWIGFRGAAWKPNAVKIEIGGINAVSGRKFKEGLSNEPQDYVVIPDQPWLDGINTGPGKVRQFVAMALGLGYTVEAALSGEEKHGGMRITVYEPRPGRFPDTPPLEPAAGPQKLAMPFAKKASEPGMGLGAGGAMKQKIYPDAHGIDVWDQTNYGSLTVHILNSDQYRMVTGEDPPPTPIDAATYSQHNLPWFELYDEEKQDVAPSEQLAGAKTIAERDQEQGIESDSGEDIRIEETQIKKLGKSGPPGDKSITKTRKIGNTKKRHDK